MGIGTTWGAVSRKGASDHPRRLRRLRALRSRGVAHRLPEGVESAGPVDQWAVLAAGGARKQENRAGR